MSATDQVLDTPELLEMIFSFLTKEEMENAAHVSFVWARMMFKSPNLLNALLMEWVSQVNLYWPDYVEAYCDMTMKAVMLEIIDASKATEMGDEVRDV